MRTVLGARRTIDNVMPSVGKALGVPGYEALIELPEAPRYVILLVDGLGLDLLRKHADVAPFLSSLPGPDDIVCGIPSTTATSLTSLGTGRRPGQHGVVGYTSRDPDSGLRLNSLTWDRPIEPRLWQPFSPVLEELSTEGIAASSVNEAKFADTGLTLCSQRGVPFLGISSVWERRDAVVDAVQSARRSVVYAYEARLDSTGHAKGCESEAWRDMLATIDADLAELRHALPSDAVLLITADHGMIDLPAEGRFDIDAQRGLRDDVTLLAGEARFRHLYTRPGTAEKVAARWSEILGDRVVVRTQEGLEDWFGKISDNVRGRIGDVVVAALDDFAMFSSRDFPREMKMIGFHGSITEAELRIPLLVAR